MKKLPIILLIFLALGVYGQSESVLKLDKESELTVSGTSSLHDWTITAEEISGYSKFGMKDGAVVSVSQLSIKVKTRSIKSGKSGMDNNTYKALNADTYEFITFSLSNSNVTKNGSKFLVSGKGNLSIAGVTKPIDLSSTCSVNGNGIKCEGSYSMKMTDFKVEPPTAMFGTIKTGDEITIDFTVTFNNSEFSKL